MLFFGTTDVVLIPTFTLIGDVENGKIVRSFKRDRTEILFCKLKKKFLKYESEIIPLEEAIYYFGDKVYQFLNNGFKEITIGKIIQKQKVKTHKKCKYKMYLVTFYDVLTQEITTRYVVET